MAKPWWEWKETNYAYMLIETPLTKYVGGSDKIIWPWIFVVLTIGGFVGQMVFR